MKAIFKQKNNRRTFLFLAVLFAAAFAFLVSPNGFRSQAETKRTIKVSRQKTESDSRGLENYDVRTDKSARASNALRNFRENARANGVLIFESDKSIAAENNLRKRVPTLKIERSEDLQTAETIAPDVKNGRAFLSAATAVKRPDALRAFVAGNKDLFGLSDKQIGALEQTKDYTNPDGNLSFTQFEQKINGVPVFRGEVKAAFTKRGELVRVINNLAPDLDYASLSNDFRNPLDAVKSAANFTDYEFKAEDLIADDSASTDLKRVFGDGDWATTAEKMYFPVESGVARAAWRVLIWEKIGAFYVIVDAETGEMLWRKNITEDQTQAATFSVYTNSNAMINVAKNPFPLNPGAVNPTFGTQGAAINRTNITRVGNEAPYAFNNKGWISDGGTDTDGNAVEAGIDRDGTDGIDASGRAAGGANRTFVFDYAPGNPNTNSGDAPVPATQTYPISAYQSGAVTQLFYICNWFHDETYRLGFTEAAGNFQADNFGRGGVGNDRVSAEAQDSSGVNNANFSPPADGSRGRMQMYLWSGPNPDFDGDLDADIVVHEFAHGLSNRLHGNSNGLNTNMARAMGEGWSDFYALSMLSQPNDPIDGVYPMGGYATYLGSGGTFTGNNYYGIRRFPKAVMSSVGANGKPHNPLTFRQINPPCNAEIGTSSAIGSISAFARGSFGSSTCDQVHAAGEVWSSALWEVRAKFIGRLGWETGNRRILQLVTDAMKISALNPTFLQARDALIAAAQASGTTADVDDVWSGFAIRGMGFSATITANGGGANNASVGESFDTPNVAQTPQFTINDSAGNNNGYADAGETILLNVPLTNTTGKTATNVSLQIAGVAGNTNYGDIANNQTIVRAVSFTVPANNACASLVNLTFNIGGSFGAKTETRDLLVGNPNAPATFTEKFDGVTVPNVPGGWTISGANPSDGSAATWATDANSASAPNALFAPDPNGYYQARIESPTVPISVSAARLKFKINYNTEAGWDGTTLDIKIGGGNYQDILDAGGKFITGAYPRYLAGTSSSNLFPNATRKAWTGNSNGFVPVEIYLPASAKNQTVQFRWTASSDVGVAGVGTYIDDVEVVGGASCRSAFISKARADYDGDGRTDFSVFRASEGNWFVNKSRDGFGALNWGVATDKPVAGDFDGDGRTDFAVYRPSSGVWFILRSSDNQVQAAQFGVAEDKPVAADYDGDGKSDIAVYRPSSGVWHILKSRDGAYTGIQFGVSTDALVPADYDGDGKTDLAVYRDGLWIIDQTGGGGISYATFGLSGDRAVPADYDGDRKSDIAVYRPSNGVWYIQRSRDGYTGYQFGVETDTPAPGDYDGDGKTDVAVYRAGEWFVLGSKDGFMSGNFGVPSDVPVPSRYIP